MPVTFLPYPNTATQAVAAAKDTGRIPLYIYAVSLASLFIVVGLFWDISWHKSIGRDGLLSPPHLLIYLGAILAGLVSGLQVLRNSFRPSSETKASLIKIWGIFYGSLGALFCIWGAIAMLTSAPFDDWWHNTYGLDVVILSPPHVLLMAGMFCLQFGSCISVSKYLNLTEGKEAGVISRKKIITLKFLFVIAAASLLFNMCLFFQGFLETRYQRLAFFYQANALFFLFLLPAFGISSRMKQGMTVIASAYFILYCLCNWIVQWFPAVPKLGPILNPVTHFQPLQFPLLYFVPAIVMDFILQKPKPAYWLKALCLSAVFILLLCCVQYPFSGFLLQSPAARNPFFGSASWPFFMDPDWEYRYGYAPENFEPPLSFLSGLALAILTGTLTARLSIAIGIWMKKIYR